MRLDDRSAGVIQAQNPTSLKLTLKRTSSAAENCSSVPRHFNPSSPQITGQCDVGARGQVQEEEEWIQPTRQPLALTSNVLSRDGALLAGTKNWVWLP